MLNKWSWRQVGFGLNPSATERADDLTLQRVDNAFQTVVGIHISIMNGDECGQRHHQ